MPDPTPLISEEAVEAAVKARHGRTLFEYWHNVGADRRLRLLDAARRDLQAAYPAIRSSVLEGLASDEAVEAALNSLMEQRVEGPAEGEELNVVRQDVREALEAALSKAQQLMEEGG